MPLFSLPAHFSKLWLKLIVLQYTVQEKQYSIHDGNVGVELHVPALLKGEATTKDCGVCGGTDITYGVSATVTNFSHPANVKTVSYVQLWASWESKGRPKDWKVVSTASVINGGLIMGDKDYTICPIPNGDNRFSVTPTLAPTLSPMPTTRNVSTDLRLHDGLDASPMPTPGPTPPRDLTPGPVALPVGRPTAKPTYETEKISCCMGNPGAVYLLACIVKEYPTDILYEKVKHGSKHFDDMCVAMDGVCGTTCGFSADKPKYCTYNNGLGTFDLEDLAIAGESDDDDDAASDHYGKYEMIYDIHLKKSTPLRLIYHCLFLAFMTISALSMWISFLPGIGVDKDPPSPSIRDIEFHVRTGAITFYYPQMITPHSRLCICFISR